MKNIKTAIVAIAALLLSTTASAQSGRWEKIEELRVDNSLERAVVTCSRSDLFDALRFRVDGSTVDFERVFVKYGTGVIDKLNFSQSVRPGQTSGTLDLKGNKRIIKEIIIYYKADPVLGRENGKGNINGKTRYAKVQVWGRH